MTQPTPCRPDGEPIPCRGCQYFTGPGCGCDNEGHTRPQNPGPRPGLDEISSDDLDTLYDRADNAEAEVDRLRAQLTSRTVLLEGHLTAQTQRAERAEAQRDRLAAELEALRHPETFNGTINDIGDLYAIHQAITDSGGQLTRPIHRALDALRNRWDLALRHEQQRNRRVVLDQHGQTPRETT